MKGWQVPSYPMPVDIEDIIVQRYVCRADFGYNMALSFVDDLLQAIKNLNDKCNNHTVSNVQGFTH